MNPLSFVITMLLCAAAFMGARALMPHLIDGMAVYVAITLCTIAMLGAVVGLVRG
jgi:hypothetical protein